MKCPHCNRKIKVKFPAPRAFQAWKLRYCDKMELAEVAERMGISYQTVLTHLWNFRQWCPQAAPNQTDTKTASTRLTFDENRDSK